jgi:hypothetical protein|tara:strand:- start:2362 stop:2568 length:207 start_codon:yes stop_codon:yes gene_type:complete
MTKRTVNISIDELTSLKAHTDDEGNIEDFDKFIECQSHFSDVILSDTETSNINKFFNQTVNQSKQENS